MHWTCNEGANGILADTQIRPGHDVLLGTDLVWLTDMWEVDDNTDRRSLGLTSQTLACDRTEWRFVVPTSPSIVPWTRWAHDHHVPPQARTLLDGAYGAQPRRWWVSESPVVPVASTQVRVSR